MLEHLAKVAIILHEPSHPGNVGATARAMKVMGLTDLRIVNPRFTNMLSLPQAIAFSSGASDILARAQLFPTIEDALADTQWSVAMAMIARHWSGPQYSPRQAADEVHTRLREGRAQKIAFLFGPERTGLSNRAVLQCRALCQIPSNPAYGSLNLAQSVQIVSYELRMAALQTLTVDPTLNRQEPQASHIAIKGMLKHLQQALIDIEFLDPKVPKRLMERLTSLFARTELSVKEVDILRGIARQMQIKAKPKNKAREC